VSTASLISNSIGKKNSLFAATHATSRNVPAVTASMISDKISIDFVREGTGKLIFRWQYSREVVDRVCKERDLTEREWVTGTLGKALSFLGLGSMSARTLQFTSTDDVVLQIQIPAMAWDAFAVCAARRKVEPASHLAVLVGRSIANGITVAEMVEWLRPCEKHARHREF
jgi:hypothetical protein